MTTSVVFSFFHTIVSYSKLDVNLEKGSRYLFRVKKPTAFSMEADLARRDVGSGHCFWARTSSARTSSAFVETQRIPSIRQTNLGLEYLPLAFVAPDEDGKIQE
jgi:hypothetical protein